MYRGTVHEIETNQLDSGSQKNYRDEITETQKINEQKQLE